MSIGTTVKAIQDIMRKDAGVDGDAQRISQLVWMLFLKVFDDHEAEKELLDEKYKSPIPQRLRFLAGQFDPLTVDDQTASLRRLTRPPWAGSVKPVGRRALDPRNNSLVPSPEADHPLGIGRCFAENILD